jgi:hypothetical protein
VRDLARLRRVRDRIGREYAQPLDVDALARGAHMSAGHLSREFRLAYGESYVYLMTRRIERCCVVATSASPRSVSRAAARRWAPSAVASPSWSLCRKHPPAPRGPRDGRDAVVRGETGDQTDQESGSAGHRGHLA